MTTAREYLEALSQGREFGDGFPKDRPEPTIKLTREEAETALDALLAEHSEWGLCEDGLATRDKLAAFIYSDQFKVLYRCESCGYEERTYPRLVWWCSEHGGPRPHPQMREVSR